MGRYRTINVDLNRQYRNDLNANFAQIEQDILGQENFTVEMKNSLLTELARIERESKERDDFLAGESLEVLLQSITDAKNSANSAASNANTKATHAQTQGDYAKSQGDYAKNQGDYAKTKGDYANEKAIFADEAASNANTEASNLSQLKVEVVTATQNANTAKNNADTATTNANNAGSYATTQGDYAKLQGDRAKNIVDGTGLLTQTDIGVKVAGFNANGQVLDKSGNVVEGKVKTVNNVSPDGNGNITVPTFSGNYNDLANKPTIPSKTSELSNDSGFLTTAPVTSVNGQTGAVNIQVNVPDASTTQKGIAQLSTSTTSTSTTEAATPSAVNSVRGQIPTLNNTLTSTSTTQAATANAVKTVNDKLISDKVVIGRLSSAGTFSTAIGNDVNAGGQWAVALGTGAIAPNHYEGVLGVDSATTGTRVWKVPGTFSVTGTKNFEMPHPAPHKKDTHVIRHGAVESPSAGDTLYRYTVKAAEDGQTVEMQLPDYFEHLNTNVDVWVNGDGHFGRAFGKVEGDTLFVTCELAGSYKVLVIGTRNDDHDSVKSWDIKGVERKIGESWTGETYVFEDDEIIAEEEYLTEVVA